MTVEGVRRYRIPDASAVTPRVVLILGARNGVTRHSRWSGDGAVTPTSMARVDGARRVPAGRPAPDSDQRTRAYAEICSTRAWRIRSPGSVAAPLVADRETAVESIIACTSRRPPRNHVTELFSAMDPPSRRGPLLISHLTTETAKIFRRARLVPERRQLDLQLVDDLP